MALVGLLLGLGVLGAVAWQAIRGQIEDRLHDRAKRMLAGSAFHVVWTGIDITPWGSMSLRGLQLQEGEVPLAAVAEVRARVSPWDVLRGRMRASRVVIDAPVLQIDVADGRPQAWLRLRDTVRRNRLRTESETPGEGLRRWFDVVEIVDGAAHVRLLGRVALLGAELHLEDIDGTLDLDVPRNAMTAHTRGAFGHSSVRIDAHLDTAAARPEALDVTLDPPLTVVPTALTNKFLHGLTLSARGLHVADGSVTVLDLAARGGADDAVVRVASVTVRPDDRAVRVQDIQAQLPAKTWLAAGEGANRPVGLPDAVTALLARGPLQLRLHTMVIGTNADHADVQAEGLEATLLDVKAKLASVHLVAPAGGLAHPERWRQVTLDGPELTIPRTSLAWRHVPELAARIDGLVALRQPAVADDEAGDEGVGEKPEPPDEPAEPRKPGLRKVKPAQPALPAAKPVVKTAQRERPSVRWIRQLQALHGKILGSSKKLEHAAYLDRLPPELLVTVSRGAATVTNGHGEPTLGIKDAGLALGTPVEGNKPLQIHGLAFDRQGEWGRFGVTVRRDRRTKGHALDVRLSGAGMAQLLASRVPGLHVGAAADIDVWATVRLPDAGHVSVAGRVEVDRMGIDWWRLSAQPIADFRTRGQFAVEVTRSPAAITVRVPEAHVGGDSATGTAGARLAGTLDITQIDTHPRVALQVDAPMQDCGVMLHAIPPSLTPTVGRIDAHGVMAWHVGLAVPLQSTGNVHVELALGDTLCTFDRFEKADLADWNGEFDRPVNENGKILEDVHIGPASGSWTPIDRIPQFVSYAMWATEDSFYRHRGISESLLAKALAIDLTSGRFIYGGSTITQQLVKNLYLKRNKALSRKFEEMLIGWQMEKIVGKRRILEIYLNGVEFGPKVYGLTRAAWAFFQKTPDQLLPEEGVYLAIIKPSPRSGYGTMRGNGWGQWYFDKTKKYMDKLLNEGNISQVAYDAAAVREFKPVFNPPARK